MLGASPLCGFFHLVSKKTRISTGISGRINIKSNRPLLLEL